MKVPQVQSENCSGKRSNAAWSSSVLPSESPHLCLCSPPLPPRPAPPPGWNKASLSVDASEENDGYSSGEEPMNSDPEDDVGKKLVSLTLKGFYIEYIYIYISCSISDCFNPSLTRPLGSREVYGDSGLREGGTSGAVRQKRRCGPANQRRRGGTVVSISPGSTLG